MCIAHIRTFYGTAGKVFVLSRVLWIKAVFSFGVVQPPVELGPSIFTKGCVDCNDVGPIFLAIALDYRAMDNH